MTGTETSRLHYPIRLLAALFAVLLLATACGADDDSADLGASSFDDSAGDFDATTTTTADSDDAVATGGESDEAETMGDGDTNTDRAAQGDDDGLGGGTAAENFTAADLGREIIFTAEITVEVDNVQAAGERATEVINGVGGFVFGQETVGGNEARSRITFKVLPERFDEALARLGEIGELRNQTISTDDVTERIVDLDSRIAVAELGVARLRTALENATDLADYAEIERLLLDRESDLEVMRGRIRTLRDQVALATITLTLRQDAVRNSIDVQITAYEGHDDGVSCPGEGGVEVEAGSEATICYEVTNTGDQTLTNITLTDTVLEIDADTPLIAVFDDLDELAPAQSALVAYEITPERTIRPRTRVSATPTDGVNEGASGPSVSEVANFEVRTFEPEEDPGFGDGFDAAKDLLLSIWTVLTILAGFLILPLLIVAPIAWVLWRIVRPRAVLAREERRARLHARYDAARVQATSPPAPAPTASTTTGPEGTSETD